MNTDIQVYAYPQAGLPSTRYQAGITYDGREIVGPVCTNARLAVEEAMNMLLTFMGDCGARPFNIQVNDGPLTPGANNLTEENA